MTDVVSECAILSATGNRTTEEEDETMRKMICAPGAYVQGPGEIKLLADHVKAMRKTKAYLIVDAFIDRTYHKEIVSSFEKENIPYILQVFGGECCQEEIDLHRAQLNGSDVVYGIGGGKTLDTSKAVAFYSELPVIIVPTAASTDAPCSRLSVVYKKTGEFSHYLPLPQNPNMVIMDSEVITKAPARFLSAGIWDALATYFEALACEKSHAVTMAGGVSTKSAMALAKLCNDTLLAKGYEAICAVKEGICNEAVEDVIEANTYLSGIGFESGGLSAAHAIHNGMTVLEETHRLLHGEKVAYGALTQLVMEQRPQEEVESIALFCKKVGLPTTLKDLGLADVTDDRLLAAAKEACQPGDTMGNMPFEVKPEMIVAAMRKVDEIGRTLA